MTFQSDHERLNRLVGAMRTAVNLLAELSHLPADSFIADHHKVSSAKYNFIAAIEAAIDIANHIISRNKLRPPDDYADTFSVLCEASILERKFADELMKMARFRNRLVHLYWDVNSGELHTILKTRLDDFESYLAQLGRNITF